jgi:uncharacterized protein with von Willebrand factor type A (vWA) domain
VSEGGGGTLAVNVMCFARVLRAAGMPIGPAAVVDALRALAAVDITRREDFRACLQAVLVHRREDLGLFAQAFQLFFRDPLGMEQILSLLLPGTTVPPSELAADVSRRVAEALHPEARRRPEEPELTRVEIEATLSYSEREALRSKDFAAMSAEELALAREAIRRMRFGMERLPTRRSRPDPRGPRVDVRASMRASLRSGGHDLPLRRRRAREEAPPLVVLCDISGSMSRYTEMLLRFAHALATARPKISCFLFGTRLTNVTRVLRHRDADVALRACGSQVTDWSGGTRIGASLDEFNRRWSRRVLGQGAIVLLITDGLDRDATQGLAQAAERLHKSCRRLTWLNPLLSFSGFQPRAQGVRALLPHVDEHRPTHNLESLEQLAEALDPRQRSFHPR